MSSTASGGAAEWAGGRPAEDRKQGASDGAGSTTEPRFAYLLLTHKDERDVEELAERIVSLSPTSQLVVHHDVEAAGLPWAGNPPEPFHLVERVAVHWGEWSMIEATARLLRYAVEKLDADWFVLLSGEHRPAVELSAWERDVAASGADALVRADELPARLHFGWRDFEANRYLARSAHRWYLVPRPRSHLAHRAIGGAMKLGRGAHPLVAIEYFHRHDAWLVGLRRRPGVMRSRRFWRGSQWLALDRRAADAVLHPDPAVRAWFEKSLIPDETYLQTLLRITPGLSVADRATSFVPEEPEQPTPGWMYVSTDDLPVVWASGAAFVRKVDRSGRPEVVQAIDAAVDRHGSPTRPGPAPPSD
jgi:hypothetical protein